MSDLPERLSSADIVERIVHDPGSVVRHGCEVIITTSTEMASYRPDGQGSATRTAYTTWPQS
ncbi:hypothetical protein [Streptomyces sp. NPDC051994]|uniref:hypothetical protein n=1 Tax=unclassified Streptomyces TaxID=2593676 RepID=UPI00341F3A2D